MVEITSGLRKIGLSRYSVVLKTFLVETTSEEDTLIPLSESPLPEPFVSGPLFENHDEMLDIEKREAQTSLFFVVVLIYFMYFFFTFFF